MLTKNKDNHNVWLEYSSCEGGGHTSETSRRLLGHLTRTWSFEKPECEPLREPWFSRTFSVMMEVSLWSITSRPLFDKNNKADHCVEFRGCVWKEEPPALQQSSVEPMPSLHFRPYKLWTECQLHKVASSFKDQNLSWFFRRYCSSEVCFLWAPRLGLKTSGISLCFVKCSWSGRAQTPAKHGCLDRARLGSGGGDTKPWKQSLGLPRFKSYKKAQLLVNSPVVWKCQVCVWSTALFSFSV